MFNNNGGGLVREILEDIYGRINIGKIDFPRMFAKLMKKLGAELLALGVREEVSFEESGGVTD